MGDAGLPELVARTAVSLAIVLAVIGVAYGLLRRRGSIGALRSSRRRASPPAIEVVGRAGLARNASAVALRFGDRVVMVGVSENASTTVLAEIEAGRWDEIHRDDEVRVPTAVPDGPSAASTIGERTSRSSFIEALRDATSKRA